MFVVGNGFQMSLRNTAVTWSTQRLGVDNWRLVVLGFVTVMLCCCSCCSFCCSVIIAFCLSIILQLRALTQVLHLPIEVIQAESPAIKIGEEYDSEPITLVYVFVWDSSCIDYILNIYTAS